MNVYAPTTKEMEWIKKNNLVPHSLPGVQSWYNNDDNRFVHSEKTNEIIATREFTIYNCVKGSCELVFESERIDQRNGETLYRVYFRADIVSGIENALAELDAKIKRFPDKKIYQLFNSVFVDKNF